MYNIAVIFGGVTPEHSITIITALSAIKNLSLNYQAVPIYINTKGQWLNGNNLLDATKFKTEPKGRECFFKPNNNNLFTKTLLGYQKTRIDCALLCLHGGEFEGGVVQGVLKIAGVPFTSPDVLPSAVSMDKVVSKLLYSSLKIPTQNFVWGQVTDKQNLIQEAESRLGYNMIIKPARCGSSVGIRIAKNRDELSSAIDFAGEFDSKIIIETALSDFRELNISLLRSKNKIKFSSVEEVECKNPFYTFSDKYLSKSTTTRIVPAKIPVKILNKILRYATKAYEALDMDGVVRFDFFAVGDKVFLNEINTIPGSLAFYLWKNEGITYTQLLNLMLKDAIKRTKNFASSLTEYNTEVLCDLDKINRIQYK